VPAPFEGIAGSYTNPRLIPTGSPGEARAVLNGHHVSEPINVLTLDPGGI
jgi:hypothetical protein